MGEVAFLTARVAEPLGLGLGFDFEDLMRLVSSAEITTFLRVLELSEELDLRLEFDAISVLNG